MMMVSTLLLNTMEKMETEQANLNEAIALTEKFVTDVKSRINRRDTNYASGVVKFLAKYFNIIDTTEPTTSATPKLATFLHCDHNQKNPAHGGTRKIPVQPTALQRRRKGIPRGSQKAAQGRPIKRKRSDDENYELKRGKPEHTKRKRNLKLNETLNQPNYFKH